MAMTQKHRRENTWCGGPADPVEGPRVPSGSIDFADHKWQVGLAAKPDDNVIAVALAVLQETRKNHEKLSCPKF